MRRTAIIALALSLPGCTGLGTFLNHTFTLPGRNPNIPMSDSENIRRALGQNPATTPLQPEPGNVWPGPEAPTPTLESVVREQNNDARAPNQDQPRPRGSSTPPPAASQRLSSEPRGNPLTPPREPQRPSPNGQIVQTPQGPAVDAGGNTNYRELTTPSGPGAIIVPNGNGTSTIINPNGSVQTIPTPR